MNTEALLSAGVPAEFHHIFTKEKLTELDAKYSSHYHPIGSEVMVIDTHAIPASVIGMVLKGEVGAIKRVWKLFETRGLPTEETFAKWKESGAETQRVRDELIGKVVPAEYVHLFRHLPLRNISRKHGDEFGTITLNFACCSGHRKAIQTIWDKLVEWGEVQGNLL